MKPLIIIIILGAFAIGQTEYEILHKDERGLIEENAFILGWEIGRSDRETEYFNELADIVGAIHGERS